MADSGRESLLRREYYSQTARIPWRDLQTWYAKGATVAVDASLDLVEVAVQLGMDNKALFERWMGEGQIAGVTDEQARLWFESDTSVWAVVSAPWVLVQERV
ncbi:MAG: DUF2288 domain-containing protein [Pseudomonadota bacterium]